MKLNLFIILFFWGTWCVQAQSPQVVSILFDACTGVEGTDEYFIFQSNSDTVFVDNMSVDYPSGGTFCNNGCGSQTLGDDASTGYLTDLNNLAGCTPPLFIYSDTIPPGATVIVFTGLPPSYVMDFSSQCGNGQFYAVFSNNQSTTGRFSNSANRTLSVDFGNGNTDDVTYDGHGGNGGTANFTNDGTVSYIVSPNCVYPLGVEWGIFNVFPDEYDAHIEWETLSEKENDYFIVERRTPNSTTFREINREKAKGNGNSNTSQNYAVLDVNLSSGIYYYRLKQVDKNGEYSYSKMRSIEIKATKTIELLQITDQQLILNQYIENTSVSIFDISGRKIVSEFVLSKSNSINWIPTSNGIYLIHFVDEKGDAQIVKFGY